ncbi:MAG: hypothetical protein SH856_01035 [Flavobacteriales bacterium]|nr:hypothetical protein [Flavobacteriales bacterium]
MAKFSGLILFFSMILFASCKKEISTLSYSVINIGEDVRMNALILLDDSVWIACGGLRDEQGWLFRSANSGTTWSKFKVDFPKSIYALSARHSGEIWAGGDFLHLWKSNDNGHNWSFHWLADQVPYHGEDRPAVRRMLWTSDSTGYFTGGENLGEGVIYYTGDGGQNWQFTAHQYEFRALDFMNDEVGIVAGHGAVFTTNAGMGGWTQTDFENDFITGLKFISDKNVLAVGYNGGIYKSGDNGKNWVEVFDSNKAFGKRVNWNDLIFDDSRIVICGNKGALALSDDEGENWKVYQLKDEPHLFSCTLSKDKILLTSESGQILQVEIP